VDDANFVSPSTGRVIRAVLFDTFGTVVDWRSGITQQVSRFATKHGLDIDPVNFADRWRGGYYPSIAKIRSGERQYVPLDRLHLENLVAALEASGIPAGSIAGDDLMDLNRAWENLPGWPDSCNGLQQIKARYIVGPLSNGNTALLVNMAKNAQLPWDAVVGLDLLYTYKPSPAAYTGAAETLRLDPGEVMLAAAHNDDLQAARAAGLATAFVRRPTEHGPDQVSDLEPTSDWDISVQSIIELAQALIPPLASGTGPSRLRVRP
jgi:2-haloacid dehalogenase